MRLCFSVENSYAIALTYCNFVSSVLEGMNVIVSGAGNAKPGVASFYGCQPGF